MRSCLGMLVAVLLLVAVLGSLATIWHLSASTEFSRVETAP